MLNSDLFIKKREKNKNNSYSNFLFKIV